MEGGKDLAGMYVPEWLHNLHVMMAHNVWPDGGHLQCRVCGATAWAVLRKYSFTTEEAAKYLAHGWPVHCDTIMGLTGGKGV